MASIIQRGGRWRALVRKAGIVRCATFSTRKAAQTWAGKIEGQAEQLRSSGVIAAHDSLAELIDRYRSELYALKQWGRSKDADLARLRRDLGHLKAADMTSRAVVEYFQKRSKEGAGGVTISAQIGYLHEVLKTARGLWHLDVPVSAVQDAKMALSSAGMVTKSRARDRRVTDAELAALCKHFAAKDSDTPMCDIVRFCVGTGMRISDVCGLLWSDLNTKDRTIIVRNRKHPSQKIGNDQTIPLLAVKGIDTYKLLTKQPKTSERCFPYNSRSVGTAFTRAVRALKLNDLHLHDLRHEAISRLFEAGYRIEQVALVSGHRDWAMLKRYTHVKAVDLHKRNAA
jgi:integrase